MASNGSSSEEDFNFLKYFRTLRLTSTNSYPLKSQQQQPRVKNSSSDSQTGSAFRPHASPYSTINTNNDHGNQQTFAQQALSVDCLLNSIFQNLRLHDTLRCSLVNWTWLINVFNSASYVTIDRICDLFEPNASIVEYEQGGEKSCDHLRNWSILKNVKNICLESWPNMSMKQVQYIGLLLKKCKKVQNVKVFSLLDDKADISQCTELEDAQRLLKVEESNEYIEHAINLLSDNRLTIKSLTVKLDGSGPLQGMGSPGSRKVLGLCMACINFDNLEYLDVEDKWVTSTNNRLRTIITPEADIISKFKKLEHFKLSGTRLVFLLYKPLHPFLANLVELNITRFVENISALELVTVFDLCISLKKFGFTPTQYGKYNTLYVLNCLKLSPTCQQIESLSVGVCDTQQLVYKMFTCGDFKRHNKFKPDERNFEFVGLKNLVICVNDNLNSVHAMLEQLVSVLCLLQCDGIYNKVEYKKNCLNHSMIEKVCLQCDAPIKCRLQWYEKWFSLMKSDFIMMLIYSFRALRCVTIESKRDRAWYGSFDSMVNVMRWIDALVKKWNKHKNNLDIYIGTRIGFHLKQRQLARSIASKLKLDYQELNRKKKTNERNEEYSGTYETFETLMKLTNEWRRAGYGFGYHFQNDERFQGKLSQREAKILVEGMKHFGIECNAKKECSDETNKDYCLVLVNEIQEFVRPSVRVDVVVNVE